MHLPFKGLQTKRQTCLLLYRGCVCFMTHHYNTLEYEKLTGSVRPAAHAGDLSEHQGLTGFALPEDSGLATTPV
ncbi:hypothetical protein AWJ24_25325 [Escherichia coli]|nr:hypothetical protein AWJ24_25325 [Escherichia coli]